MSEFEFLTLQECSDLFGGRIPASTFRAEIHAGRLKCIRARPGCNAPILVSKAELKRWVSDVAGKRQAALSPAQAAAAVKAAGGSDAS